MKKLMTLILAFMMVLSLAACGNGSGDQKFKDSKVDKAGKLENIEQVEGKQKGIPEETVKPSTSDNEGKADNKENENSTAVVPETVSELVAQVQARIDDDITDIAWSRNLNGSGSDEVIRALLSGIYNTDNTPVTEVSNQVNMTYLVDKATGSRELSQIHHGHLWVLNTDNSVEPGNSIMDDVTYTNLTGNEFPKEEGSKAESIQTDKVEVVDIDMTIPVFEGYATADKVEEGANGSYSCTVTLTDNDVASLIQADSTNWKGTAKITYETLGRYKGNLVMRIKLVGPLQRMIETTYDILPSDPIEGRSIVLKSSYINEHLTIGYDRAD